MYNRSGSHEALLSGAPLPTLLYFALPIILGNVFQQLYSICLLYTSPSPRD